MSEDAPPPDLTLDVPPSVGTHTVSLSLPFTLSGPNPVVVLGPNGAGKSTLGRALERAGASRVHGHRTLTIGHSAISPMQVNNHWRSQNSSAHAQHYISKGDFDVVLIRLIAKSAHEAQQWRRSLPPDQDLVSRPKPTPLDRVDAVWRRVMPDRELSLSDGPPRVGLDAGSSYLANEMSDGERTCLYLLLQVIAADAGTLVIDEPTLHLHGLLAIRLWTALEEARRDCRFVYLTHDLPFALSRRSARLLVSHGSNWVDVPHGGIPHEVIETTLGAATMSRTARTHVLCEGGWDGYDYLLYSTWFRSQDVAVVPVGSSSEVIEVSKAMRSTLVQGGRAVAIIDGDELTQERRQNLTESGVFVLPFSEVEAIFCLMEFVEAVAALPANESRNLREKCEDAVRTAISRPHEIDRQTLRRTKRLLRERAIATVDGAKFMGDHAATKAALVESLNRMWDKLDPSQVLEEEREVLVKALGGTWEEVLAAFPGKDYVASVATALGYKDKDAFIRQCVGCLRRALEKDEVDRSEVERRLVEKLREVLPDVGSQVSAAPTTDATSAAP